MHPNDGRVVSSFIMRTLTGQPISIYGDGTQTRSFCYVDDLIDGLTCLMDGGEGVIGPINLGNPVEISIKELAARVVEMTNSASPIIYNPLPADDPIQRCPDITCSHTGDPACDVRCCATLSLRINGDAS